MMPDEVKNFVETIMDAAANMAVDAAVAKALGNINIEDSISDLLLQLIVFKEIVGHKLGAVAAAEFFSAASPVVLFLTRIIKEVAPALASKANVEQHEQRIIQQKSKIDAEGN